MSTFLGIFDLGGGYQKATRDGVCNLEWTITKLYHYTNLCDNLQLLETVIPGNS